MSRPRCYCDACGPHEPTGPRPSSCLSMGHELIGLSWRTTRPHDGWVRGASSEVFCTTCNAITTVGRGAANEFRRATATELAVVQALFSVEETSTARQMTLGFC